MNRRPFFRHVGPGLIVVLMLTATACGSSSKPAAKPSKTVVLMTHDSFAASAAVLAQFTRETGFRVNPPQGPTHPSVAVPSQAQRTWCVQVGLFRRSP